MEIIGHYAVTIFSFFKIRNCIFFAIMILICNYSLSIQAQFDMLDVI